MAASPEYAHLLAAPCLPPAPKAKPKQKAKAVENPPEERAGLGKKRKQTTQESKLKHSGEVKPLAKSKAARKSKSKKADKSELKVAAKARPKAKAKGRAKAKSSKQKLETRKRNSRKSKAYHAAVRKAVESGATKDEARIAGREALWHALFEMLHACL